MKHFIKQKPIEAKTDSRLITELRDVVDHRTTPEDPERRILPANRSEVAHQPGAPLQVANYDRKKHTFDISVIPTSLSAHVIDKALSAAMVRMRGEAAERNEPYDEAAETAVVRFNGPLADMRQEAKWARHEMRPAEPVMFRGHGAEMIFTGLSELVNQGERPGANASAVQDGDEARDVLLTIGAQINHEIENPAEPIATEQRIGSLAAGAAATIDLPYRGAEVPAAPQSEGHN